jgi:hypothetical protein
MFVYVYMLSGLIQAMSFGANEQVMTLMCALTGFLNKDKKKILYILAVTAIAASIPDVYSYYRENATKKDVSNLAAAGLGMCVFGIELVIALLLGVPLLLLKNKKAIAAGTYSLGIIIIFINEMYLLKNSLEQAFLSSLFAMCAVWVSYFLSEQIAKIFGMKEN